MLHRHKAGSEYYALKIKNQAVAADAFLVAGNTCELPEKSFHNGHYRTI